MRSFHTQASTHDQSRPWACASCLASFGTADASLSLCLLMALPLPPSWNPRFALPSLCAALLTALYHDLLAWNLIGSLITCSTVKALTPVPVHFKGRSPRLTSPYLPIVPSPTTQCAPIPLSTTTAYRATSGLRHRIAGSPQHNAESSSLSYGPTVRLRLLPTPLRGNAVTFGYGAVAHSDTDLRRADLAPSRAHDSGLRRNDEIGIWPSRKSDGPNFKHYCH